MSFNEEQNWRNSSGLCFKFRKLTLPFLGAHWLGAWFLRGRADLEKGSSCTFVDYGLGASKQDTSAHCRHCFGRPGWKSYVTTDRQVFEAWQLCWRQPTVDSAIDASKELGNHVDKHCATHSLSRYSNVRDSSRLLWPDRRRLEVRSGLLWSTGQVLDVRGGRFLIFTFFFRTLDLFFTVSLFTLWNLRTLFNFGWVPINFCLFAK